MGNHWTLQDADKNLSAVVEAARRGEPQHVNDGNGVEAVVVLSAEEYARLTGEGDAPPHTSSEPQGISFVDHILNFPKLPEGYEDIFDKKEPMIVEMNEPSFKD